MIERIKAIISYYQLTDRAFSIKCGIKQNTLSRQLSGTSDVSLQTINSILDNYKDVSSEWLLRGNGDMILSSKQQDTNIERIERLIDTIATLQEAINEKSKSIQLLEEENKKLKNELTTLKDERKIG